jgi:hypothetical protein
VTGRADRPGTPERGAEELALDVLGSARARRERYVGPWLPEPLVEDLSGTDPADRVTLDESVSMALLVVLERLSPAERTSFRLHDVLARWLLWFMRRPPALVRLVTVNGGPGLAVRDGGGVLTVVSFTMDRGRITALDVVRNPDKLAAVPELAD